MAEYDECIVFLLAKAYQKAHGELKKRLKVHGLTPVQYLILEVLWQDEGLSAGEIGKKLVLDNATLSGVLDRLSEAGWIVKEADKADRRFVRVSPTPRARHKKSSLVNVRKEANETILSRLSLEEKILLKRMLKELQV